MIYLIRGDMMQKQIILSAICLPMIILEVARALEEPPKGLHLFHEIAVQHKPGVYEAQAAGS